MLRLARPTFRSKKSNEKRNKHSNSADSLPVEGPILPTIGSFSQCGRKHPANEDRVLSVTLSEALGSAEKPMVSFADMLSIHPDDLMMEEVQLVGVFDGHGGSGCVDFISKNIANRIAQAVSKEKRKFEQLESAVVDGFKACEDEFAAHALEAKDNSGCCALVALLHQNKVLVSWAGDCRAVYFNGKRAEQLSVDHRPTDSNEYKRIIDNGGSVTNNRLNGVLAPSRCFGDMDIRSSTPDGVLIAEPAVAFKANIDEQAIRKQTAFMILATDGIWDVFNNESACDIVSKALKANGHNAQAAAAKLVEEAAERSADDLSVTVVTWNVVPWDEYSGIITESWGLSDDEEKR